MSFLKIACARLSVSADERKNQACGEIANEGETAGREKGRVCESIFSHTSVRPLPCSLPEKPFLVSKLSGSFSIDDGDGTETVKTAIGLLSKTTGLHVHHAFLYIS